MMRDEPAIMVGPLTVRDLPAALGIQAAAYPPFLVEDEAAFRSRITLAHSYCFAAKHGDLLIGYILAHGWASQSPPPVGAVLTDGAANDILYIHDLALSPAGRGHDLGHRLVTCAFHAAARDGIERAELIAVQGAARYWRALGFHEEQLASALAGKVATYGADARWMVRDIRPA